MLSALLILSLVIIAGCERNPSPAPAQPDVQKTAELPQPTAEYIGNAACVSCHAEASAAYAGSHHDLAMQPANAGTVLGDFNNASFEYNQITTTFHRQNEAFYVHTDGPDGSLQDFPVRYTFGVDPLQQYLIELPGGRLQALSIAWDTRPREAGGQRWFHLYPDERIDHKDPLHWTGPNQNWNSRCAECHSTAIKRNYDPQQQTWDTRWAALNVACEACHGPASVHAQLAASLTAADLSKIRDKGLIIDYRNALGGSWQFSEGDSIANNTHPLDRDALLPICMPCHSRRNRLVEEPQPGQSFYANYLPSLLEEGLYFADGQIDGEVFEYGSFLQSRMYQAGVQCLDCHDPHSLKLRAEGNALCNRCHQASHYDKPTHHFHDADSAGASCVACHMPERTYMQVDARHDHSFRIPRPDLSERLGLPNTCNACHPDKSSAWATEAIRAHDGGKAGEAHFAETLSVARKAQITAAEGLRINAADAGLPDIVRATLLNQLASYPDSKNEPVIQAALDTEQPLLRLGALLALTNLPPVDRCQPAARLLDDPIKAVHYQAAAVCAAASGNLTAEDQRRLDTAISEYLAAQAANAEYPWSHVNIGNLRRDLGDLAAAEHAYNQALALEPEYIPAAINLADLYRSQEKDDLVLPLLRETAAGHPDNIVVLQALGMALVREKNYTEALDHFAQAAKLAPEDIGIQMVHAIALNSTGKTQEAMTVLQSAYRRQPQHPDLLYTLATLYRDAGDPAAATRYARELLVVAPDNNQARQLLEEVSSF